MVKICIISAAEDKILQRFIDSLQNIEGDYHCYILRNKPSEITLDKSVKNITMKIVENENYRDEFGKIQLLKLRLESVMMSDPKDGDIIMFGDDDMIFRSGFTFQVLPLFEKGAGLVSCQRYNRPATHKQCRDNGIWNGLYVKYEKEFFDILEKNKEYSGGGEDGFICFKYYDYSKGNVIFMYDKFVSHIGYNSQEYTKQGDGADSSKIAFHLYYGTAHYDDNEKSANSNELFENCLNVLPTIETKVFWG